VYDFHAVLVALVCEPLKEFLVNVANRIAPREFRVSVVDHRFQYRI
jgi:hypothetical protein